MTDNPFYKSTDIPFYKPTVYESSKKMIQDVLDLKIVNVDKKLEHFLCQYFDSSFCVSTINPTGAIYLSLLAMNLKRGDKVLCSVNSFPVVAEVVRHFEAEPIFVDINKDDFNIDIKQFEEVLSLQCHKKLKAAFINHVAGQSADLDPIYELAQKYEIKIIDDASSALGAKYKGKKLGSTGSFITCFSLNPQTCSTIASGGAILTNDSEVSKRAKLLRNHAIMSDDWDDFGNIGYIYDVVDIGLKCDISELGAAFNIGNLENIDKQIKRRQEIAAIYDEELSQTPHISIPVKKRDHIYTKYIIKIDKNRDSFAKELKEKGIYTALHYVPLHLLSYYKQKYSLKVNDFPAALSNYQHILSIPIYDSMTDDMVARVCETIKSIAKKRE